MFLQLEQQLKQLSRINRQNCSEPHGNEAVHDAAVKAIFYNNKFMKRLIGYFFTIGILFIACKPTPPAAITEADAVRIAEEFVIKQGYTDLPTSITMKDAMVEEEEFATSIEKLLESRQGLLESKAWEARKFKEQSMWAVGFNFTSDEPNVGRCVIMDTLGNDVHMKEGQLRMDWLLDDLPPAEKQKKMDLMFE